MKGDKIFSRKPDGRVIEIGNWEARTSENDAFVGTPLSDSGLRKLRSGRKEGKSDQQIFYDIHNLKRGIRPALSIDELTVQQLSKIASDLLEENLDSLMMMTKEDLVQLVRRLAKLKKVQISFDVDLE